MKKSSGKPVAKQMRHQVDLRYLDNTGYHFQDKYQFEGLPASEARKLMTGYPNIEGEDKQNFSPKAKELVKIAEKYNGTLSGYVIPEATGRKDARITLNGFTITCPSKEMREIRKKLKETDREPDTTWVLDRNKRENLTEYKLYWD